jgi:hypothetical protein
VWRHGRSRPLSWNQDKRSSFIGDSVEPLAPAWICCAR